MQDEPTSIIISRIQWCRLQEQNAMAPHERAGWRAEEAGLVDALGSRDRIAFMRKQHPSFFSRYQIGIKDGQALLRLSTVTPMRHDTHAIYQEAQPAHDA